MKYLYKNKLVELREEKDIKQYTLARFLNFHDNAYGQFEREDTILPLYHLNSLCNYFDVSLDYIFSFTSVRQYKNNIGKIDNALAAKRLKDFRKEKKLTQEDLAKILTLTKSSISKYEKGYHTLSTSSLFHLCSNFHLSADYLLGKIDEPKYIH